ncbi:MAG: outer membrane beta-barrel protein [Spirosomataceae bacterium]
MKTFILLFPFLFIFQSAHSQTISGSVSSELKPVEYATVTLHRAVDSVFVKGEITDSQGGFLFENLKVGRYFLRVSQVGFDPFTSPLLVINSENPKVNLPNIQLITAVKNLNEVTVVAKKPFIERKLDRTIINVEGSIVSTGNSILEVLERSPGVVVNQESSLALRGKQGVIVMIDGKPTPLSGADLLNYLKGIPSANIERIEIVTNPSAKYDAAGNAGIIDIRFKKDQREGTNGNYSLSYGQGRYRKPTLSGNLNYRKKKWNLFGNYSFSAPQQYTMFYINRKFFDSNRATTSVFDQTSYIKQPLLSHVGKIGADLNVSKQTVIGVMLNANFLDHTRDGFTNSIISEPTGALRSTAETENLLSEHRYNVFGNVNFKHSFKQAGRELTMDVDWGKFGAATGQNFVTDYFNDVRNPLNSEALRTDQNGSIEVKSVKADYVHPLEKKAKWEAGIKSSLVKTDNDIKFFDVLGGNEQLDTKRSNHFIYSENVNAAYLNVAKTFEKTDFQAGLRMEHTVTKGEQVTTGESFSRNYAYLFPSVFINQKLSKSHQLSLSYSRRIDRPNYRQLNPFRIFVDPFTYVVGDPTLRPVLSNSFEMNHTFKDKYVTSLSYTQSKQVITDVFAQDDATKISYQIPANLQDFDQVNLGVTIPVVYKKWFNSSINASLYWNRYDSPLQGGNLVNEYTSWDIRMNNSFVFGTSGWSAELSGFYQARNAWGLFIIKNLAQVSAGIQKTSKDRKSTLKLSMTDLFYTNHIAVVVNYQNMDFFTDRRWDSRVLTFSFTRRFGSNTVAQARRRNTGVEDERRRAN